MCWHDSGVGSVLAGRSQSCCKHLHACAGMSGSMALLQLQVNSGKAKQ